MKFLCLLALLPLTASAQQTTSELVRLTASDPADDDEFGYAIAVSGDTIAVGERYDDAAGADAGAVHVYERNQGGPDAWGEVIELTASGASAQEQFGFSLDLDGDTLMVFSRQSGWVYVFERDQGGPQAWGETLKLVGSDAPAGWSFGHSIALEGDTAVIGSPFDTHSGKTSAGSAYVFERDQGGPGAWGEVAKIIASDAASFFPDDNFGWSVGLSGDLIVVGAPGDDELAQKAGAAFVFGRDQGGADTWGEVAKLLTSDGKDFDYFGAAVAIHGDTVLAGAWADGHHKLSVPGSAYVFERDQGGASAWGQTVKLIAGDFAALALFGSSVAIQNDTAVIGAPGDNHSGVGSAGSAYVYERDQGGAGTWGEVEKLVASAPGEGDHFGWSVALAGATGVVGALDDDHAGGIDAGSTYIFSLSFPFVTYCTPGTSASGCTARLSSSGTASATSASGFTLLSSDVEGSKDGMYFFGVNGRQANTWGSGTSFQCVLPPVQRTGLLTGSGTPGACDGSFAQDLNALWCPSCPQPQKNPGAGAWVQAQLWYRDPQNTSNQSTSLSDAIEFLIAP